MSNSLSLVLTKLAHICELAVIGPGQFGHLTSDTLLTKISNGDNSGFDFYGLSKSLMVIFFVVTVLIYAHKNTIYQLIAHSIDD